MKELIELIKAINMGRLKTGGLWAFVFEPGSLMEQLCTAVAEGRVKSDEDAAALLYPGQKAGAKLINLRERLKERLHNVLFLLEFRTTGNNSDRQQAFVECNKKWSTAMVLMSKNAKNSSIELMEDMLKQTLHFEFTELSLGALSALRLHYGTTHDTPARYNLYRDLYREHQEIWLMENEAEDLYTNLVSHFASNKLGREALSELARAYYERIAPFMERCGAFRLHLSGRLIQLMIYSSNNDHAATAKICEEAIAFFQKKAYKSTLPLQAFYYQLIVCYLQLREFDKGQLIIEQQNAIFEEGSFNWFKLRELFFLLAMHTQHYDEAFDICEQTQERLQTANPPAQVTEMWKIYEAYTQYLLRVGKLKNLDRGNSKFKFSKFLNETPTYAKDKQGMNISILVAHILYSISDRNYHQAIDRMEAVEKYCSRYLKHNETFRSNCFIKALLQIPAASFHREAAVRKAQKYVEQLNQHPLEVAYQRHELEIVPYEHLWEIAIGTLQNQIQRQRPGPSLRATAR